MNVTLSFPLQDYQTGSLIDIKITFSYEDTQDDCGKDTKQAFTFKPSRPSVNGTSGSLTEVTEIHSAEVCCCTSSGDM